jgi:hypothetical protein
MKKFILFTLGELAVAAVSFSLVLLVFYLLALR